MTGYADYRLKFADLAQGLAGLKALGEAGLFDPSQPPMNALGNLRDNSGAIVADPDAATWVGGKGTPASSFTDPDSGEIIQIPARGDGSSWYVDIRSDQASVVFDPSQYGMTVTDREESAEVLGVWA